MTAFRTLRTWAHRLALDEAVEFWAQTVDPTFSLTESLARIIEIRTETADMKTFVLAPNRLWQSGRAGQFVSVTVEIDGARVQRCYSLSSAPGAAVTITVKRVPGGRVSNHLHDHVRVDDVIGLGPAQGAFVLDEAPRPLLLLSGGSGITPVMAMLRESLHELADVVFVHAARSLADVPFHAELRALELEYPQLRVVLWLDDEQGRLGPAALASLVPDVHDRRTMLCGPAGMMAGLRPLWADHEHALRTEAFAPPARTSSRNPGRVTLTLLERTVETDSNATLLEQLEAAGERPAYGCRLGICHTCRCQKREGQVENVLTGEISNEPDEEIRLCVSRALGDVTLAL